MSDVLDRELGIVWDEPEEEENTIDQDLGITWDEPEQIPNTDTMDFLTEYPSQREISPPSNLTDIYQYLKAFSEPEVEKAKIDSSIMLSEMLDIPARAAYVHLDSFMAEWTAEQEKSPLSFHQRLKDVWRGGRATVDVGMLRSQQLLGDDSLETQQKIDFYKQMQPSPENMKRALPARMMLDAAEMAPLMLQGMREGGFWAAAAGGAATLATVATGGALAPMIPFAIRAGMTVGSTKTIGLAEAGLMYDELLDLRDDEGNPIEIDPIIMKVASLGVGGINAALEFAQMKLLLSFIPGANMLVRSTLGNVIKKAVRRGVFKPLLRYGAQIAVEDAQEVAQEFTNIVFTELGIELNNRLKGTKYEHQWNKAGARILETLKKSTNAFMLMTLPGSVSPTISAIKETKKEAGIEVKRGEEKAGIPIGEEKPPGQAQLGREEALLLEEAKKHKSADEFVKNRLAFDNKYDIFKEGVTRYEQEQKRREAESREGIVPESSRDWSVSSVSRGRQFYAGVKETYEKRSYGQAVEVKEPQFYTDLTTKLFLSPDSSAGVAVTPEGDLVSVFKTPISKQDINPILAQASDYAISLDAFDINSFLPNLYAPHGWRPIARLRFNKEKAPPNWDYDKLGEPDIVQMVRDVEGVTGALEIPSEAEGGYASIKDKVPLLENYDDFITVRNEALKKIKSRASQLADTWNRAQEGVPPERTQFGSIEEARASLAEKLSTKPLGAATQPIADIETIYKQAEEARPDFDTLVSEIVEQTGAVERRDREGLKKQERAEQKIKEDYPKEGASRILDVMGTMLTYDSEESVLNAANMLADDERVVRIKNGYETESHTGYKDIKVNIQLPNGHIAEIILIDEKMREARHVIGHTLYKIERDLIALERDKSLTLKELETVNATLQKIIDAEKILYSVVGVTPSRAVASEIASSLEMIRESGLASTWEALSTDIAFEKLPSAKTLNVLRGYLDTAKGVPSYSKYRNISITPPTIAIVPEGEKVKAELQEKLDRVQKQAEKKLEKASVKDVLAKIEPEAPEIKELAMILRDREIMAWENDKAQGIDAKKPSTVIKDYMEEARNEYEADMGEYIRTEAAKEITGGAVETGAKRGVTAGKKMGVAQEKARKREVEAKAKARKAKADELKKMAKRINRPVAKGTDFYYAQMIDHIRGILDPKNRTKKTIERRKKTREFLEQHPEHVEYMPTKILDLAYKKSLGEFTIEEIREMDEEVERLRQLGKKKYEYKQNQRKRVWGENNRRMIESIMAGHLIGPPVGEIVGRPKIYPLKTFYLSTLIPQSWLDMADGGRADYDGPVFNTFYNEINAIENQKQEMEDTRRAYVDEGLKSLGIKIGDLLKTREVGRTKYRVADLMGIWGGAQNKLHRAALIHGNHISEQRLKEIDEALTDKEKEAVAVYMEDFELNYPRFREAYIEYANEDPGYQDSYLPMFRQEVDKEMLNEMMAEEMINRANLKRVYPPRGMTKLRKEHIPPEFQKPVKTNIVEMWHDAVQREEHLVAYAAKIRDLHNHLRDPRFKEIITRTLGQPWLRRAENYVNAVANPNIYRQMNEAETVSRAARKRSAIAYLAGNLVTMGKQLPSLFYYMHESSPGHVMGSLLWVASHPMEAMQFVNQDPQMKHLAMERELEEMKSIGKSAYGRIVNKIGIYGTYGIRLMDKIAKTIGYISVYTKFSDKGYSDQPAREKALNATLRTQPAAAAKDISEIYRTNEAFNLFLQFSNQLNKIYNMVTYDIPASFKGNKYYRAIIEIGALALGAMMIWTIRNRRLPEDEEDMKDVFTDFALSIIPFFGKIIASARSGWQSGLPAAFQPIVAIGTALGEKASIERRIKAMIEATAVATGMPYIAGYRGYKSVKEEDITELVGGPPTERGR